MTDNVSNTQQKPGTDKRQFYRSRLSGLSVKVGDPLEGEVAPQSVRFTAFEERYQGDKIKVGYLATDNQRAIDVLNNDPNVESISEKEYNDATDVEKGAKRATF